MMPGENDFVWTGNWPDAVAFMDRVGYAVPFLGRPALCMAKCVENETEPSLHVINDFTEQVVHCDPGDVIRWFPSTRSFAVVA